MCNQKKAVSVSILLALAVGALSGLMNRSAMAQYPLLNQPPLAPPMWIFPVVWTVLYVLMGIGAALVYCGEGEGKKEALRLYGVQLAFNFLWSFFFFTLEWRLFALGWLLALIVLVAWMIRAFYQISPKAAYLQIPYLIWLIFAAYLNMSVWLLNR